MISKDWPQNVDSSRPSFFIILIHPSPGTSLVYIKSFARIIAEFAIVLKVIRRYLFRCFIFDTIKIQYIFSSVELFQAIYMIFIRVRRNEASYPLRGTYSDNFIEYFIFFSFIY